MTPTHPRAGTWLVACLVAAAPAPALALSFSGSFSGIADAIALPFGDPPVHPLSFYDGALVTGTFAARIPDDHLATAEANTNVSFGTGGSTITFDIRGEQFTYEGGPGDALVPGVMQAFYPTPGAPGQLIAFRNEFSPRFDGASFFIGSDRGALFEGTDLGTLRITPATVSSFDAFFSSFAEKIQVDVDVTSFRINPLAAPVPEPASWALLLVGGAALGVHQRRKLRAASRNVPI